MKFGISFTTTFLNQGNALVNLYLDGTVQVSTGGTEMGQGLNTKIRLIVAGELGVEYDSVRVMETSTEKNNNTAHDGCICRNGSQRNGWPMLAPGLSNGWLKLHQECLLTVFRI